MSNAFWSVTSYFNPTGSQRRLANYRAFRRALDCPLLAVEWSHEGRFELGPGDAELLVQIPGGDLMWQKERLLNLGIERLPPECRHIAWLDCDIVFDRFDWVAEAVRRLADAAIVQLYDRVAYLARTPLERIAEAGDWSAFGREFERIGSAAARAAGLDGEVPVATDDVAAFRRMPSTGFAWAATRELLQRHPFFDFWIVGGGDSAYVHAAAGSADQVVRRHGLSSGHRGLFIPRANALAAEVAGRVDFVPGTLFHLWHGELEDRRYRSRHDLLSEHDFDPARFLRRAASGAWAWADVPATLPLAIRGYFEARHEDGADARIA